MPENAWTHSGHIVLPILNSGGVPASKKLRQFKLSFRYTADLLYRDFSYDWKLLTTQN